jgi:hypothetical protein
MAAAYVMSEVPKFIAYPPNAVKRILQVDFIDQKYKFHITLAGRNRLVVCAWQQGCQVG